MALKVFISLPMHGKTIKEIYADRQAAVDKIKKENLLDGQDFVVIETIRHDAPPDAGRLWYLGRSISALDQADYIYMAAGWEQTNGCIMEFMAAKLYGVPIIAS